MNSQPLITPLSIIQGHTWVINRSALEKEVFTQEFFHLHEPYLTVVLLHDHYQWSYGKIAYRLERSVGTVKAQICRGRRILASYSQRKEA